jgi:hypothetical protein
VNPTTPKDPTQRPTRHVCIATGQNLANLIPCLQLSAREVVILETQAMRDAAGNLKRALEAHGIAVRRMPFDDATPESIVRAAEAVALELGEAPLVFNATGGHKLMTLALADQMQLADNLHLVYAETRHDRLDWLKPAAAVEPMHDVLDLNDILLAQGYRRTTDAGRDVQWQTDADRRGSLTRRMGDEAHRHARFFGALNRLADLALNEDGAAFRPHQELEFGPGGHSADLLREASRLDLLHWDEDTEIVFSSPEAAQYFRGGWLEEYLWIKLRGLRPHDWAVNVRTRSAALDVENEFDALLVHRNRLLVVECKTSSFGRSETKDVGYIYKLAQVAVHVGGSMSRKLLLSARPIHADIRQRADEYGVDILAAEDVKKLVGYLRDWMAG